jgi:VHL beta domain
LQQGIVAFAFGLVFIGVMLYIALKVPNPTDSQWFTFRVILALAAGGIGAVLPGALDLTVAPSIRAGGALALVVLVFWFNPPKLVAGKDQGKDQSTPDDQRPQDTEDAEALDCKQLSSIRSQDGGDKTLVTFENKTSGPVSIYWIGTDGGEQSYAQIVAGGRLPQETFVGHAWLVKDQNNNCLAVFRAVWRDSIAVIQ